MPKTKDGIACPRCHGRNTPVYYTRSRPPVIRRVRKCRACGRRFLTIEAPLGVPR